MRTLLFLAITYVIFKLVKRVLNDLQIRMSSSNEVKGRKSDTAHRLKVDEADIEDAEFKDVE